MSTSTPQEQILGIVNNHWQSCCVGAAAQLELADLLADGPLHVDVLANLTKTHGPSLFRMMRALESTGIFTQTSPRVFGNTATSECLRRNRPGSNWAWIRFTLCSGAPVFEGWRGLMLALQNGRPGFDQVTGEAAWQHMQSNPQTYTIFNEAMRDLSTSISPAVAAALDWSEYPVVADIGGGIGSQLVSILDAHPSCQGVVFDQPNVVAQAPENSRMKRVGGDFFKDVPVYADAYVMRWLLHDWSDEESVAILTNVKRVAKPNARLMLVESVIPETPEFDMGKWMDLNMLVMATGRERTAAEFRSLLSQSGFEVERIVPTGSPLSIVVAKLR
jgi:ubiquinone/menaquinone biosynthesis C-methylase UbiE